ncbi:MAG: pyridoxal-phosphate dependent enzyme [Caulobacteraceae bacterium]
MSPAPGDLTFALNGKRLTGALGVSDEEALAAMAFAFRHLKLVLEPGGAAALAAVLSGKLKVAGQTVVVIASGGNVDADIYARAIA